MIRWFYNNIFARHLEDVLPLYGFKKIRHTAKYLVYEKEIFRIAFKRHQQHEDTSLFYFFANGELVETLNTKITKELILIKRLLKIIDKWRKIEILKDL